MKVLITGGGGQLSNALAATVPAGHALTVLSINELDITRPAAVAECVDALRPDAIVNAAAYTAVDAAETNRDEAYAVNAGAASHLAQAAARTGARLVHVSTDFVFDGRQSTPYQPEDRPNPLGVYGASKLEGERLVGSAMTDTLIVRTAWVYAEGGRNFVHTILRLCAERESLRVVVDQVGSPTWAPSLATAIWQALDRDVRGLHHWTDSGAISWYDFAQAIQEEALVLGLLARRVPIHPIRSSEYPTPATRPHYSVLDCSGLARAIGHAPPYWRDNLRQMLRNHAETLRNHA